MDWFRWWHGTLTDPKFQWVARKSGQPFTAVIALWVALLERASSVTQGDATVTRGDVSGFDCDDYDVLFGLDDGSCARIFEAFVAKAMITDSAITNWEKRQPKREDSSAARTRAYRERKSQEAPETTGDAPVTQRDDKRREEERRENIEPNGSVDSGEKASPTADLLGDCEGNGEQTGERSEQSIPPCPAQQIVDLYHECMPLNPRVKIVDDARKGSIRARWKQAAMLRGVGPFGYATGQEGLKAWRRFFEVCAESEFLTGRATPRPGKKPFVADIDFLTSPKGFKKCLENRYHEDD